MSIQLFSNNAGTTLAGNITSGSLSLSVLTGSGALFPVIAGGSGNWWIGTLNKASAPATLEIVKVTATSTDTFTIVRAQEGTTALAWNAGDTFSMFCSAGTQANFIQPAQLQAQGGAYAADTGPANAYVVGLTPALTAHVVGMPIRWRAGHANTGASTFNDGAGSAAMIIEANVGVGGALAPGNIAVGGMYVCMWDGVQFVLLNPSLFIGNGQFSAALTGVSGSANVTFNWSRVFDQVMLFNTTGNVAASTGSLLSIPTLPAAITPLNTKIVPAGSTSFVDNSVIGGFAVDAQILNTGGINFLKNGSLGWSGTGNKGINGVFGISYTVG